MQTQFPLCTDKEKCKWTLAQSAALCPLLPSNTPRHQHPFNCSTSTKGKAYCVDPLHSVADVDERIRKFLGSRPLHAAPGATFLPVAGSSRGLGRPVHGCGRRLSRIRAFDGVGGCLGCCRHLHMLRSRQAARPPALLQLHNPAKIRLP